MKSIMEASEAVAQAVKRCRPHVIPMYPITPQTHIVERLADYINDGLLKSDMIHVESEHSAISAAIGVTATGARTFTATASQGLALMHEILHIVSGMRLPIVMAVANRALSAPINIWNDHQDSISARDTGWIQIYVESSQEAFDTIIHAYRISEDHKVLLPVMVCLDGFTLSHVYEPVDMPDECNIKAFLPDFKPLYRLDAKKPLTMGPVGFPDTFMGFKKQQQDAMETSISIIKQVNRDYGKEFGRSYGDGLVELYQMKDAKIAVCCMGTISGTARVVIDKLRQQGTKAGLIRIRTYRPFPAKELQAAVSGLDALAVFDRDISLGHEGALYSDIRSVLFGKDLIINSIIAGLGGKDITTDDIEHVIKGLAGQKAAEWLL